LAIASSVIGRVVSQPSEHRFMLSAFSRDPTP
jgi:hypothetical protein